MTTKIGIVGADGRNRAWTPEREDTAKRWIHLILDNAKKGSLVTNIRRRECINRDFDTNVFWDFKQIIPNDLVVVSGHCPVGEEKWYCPSCDEFVDSFCHSQGHMNSAIKVYDEGGVDTKVEIVAAKLGIKTEIYSPTGICECKKELPLLEQCYYRGKENVKGFVCEGVGDIERYYAMNRKRGEPHAYIVCWKVGWEEFKRRNIKIATVSDVLYDLEPKGSCKHCGGKGYKQKKTRWDTYTKPEQCNFCEGTGNYSGGTWTKNYAEKLGKEVFQAIIE